MTDQDQAELLAWRFAFGDVGDGTPDGAACAIDEQITALQAECDKWKRVAQSLMLIAKAGSVYEITSNDNEPQ